MAQKSADKKIGIIIVSYGHENIILNLLNKLGAQKKVGDLIVVVDNHPNKSTALIAKKIKSIDKVLELENKGFANGCNEGARLVKDKVDILFFLNPDTIPDIKTLDTIRYGQDGYGITMPLLVMRDGKINSAGNSVHISGLSWCDEYGVESKNIKKNINTFVVSGACLAITVSWWDRLNGMSTDYFMYYEDNDLCTRAVLMGATLAVLPEAKVIHDYDFIKGDHKWFYLERNRPLYILRCWPLGIILFFVPLFVVVEACLWFVALMQKRFRLRIKSQVSMLKAIPAALKARKLIKETRIISYHDFLRTLTPNLDSPFFGDSIFKKIADSVFRAYFGLAKIIF